MAVLEDFVKGLNEMREGELLSISGKLVVRKIPGKIVEDDTPNRLFEYEALFDIKKTGKTSYEISDAKGEFAMSLDASTGWMFLKDGDFTCVSAKSMQCQKPEKYQKLIAEKKPDQVMLYPTNS